MGTQLKELIVGHDQITLFFEKWSITLPANELERILNNYRESITDGAIIAPI